MAHCHSWRYAASPLALSSTSSLSYWLAHVTANLSDTNKPSIWSIGNKGSRHPSGARERQHPLSLLDVASASAVAVMHLQMSAHM